MYVGSLDNICLDSEASEKCYTGIMKCFFFYDQKMDEQKTIIKI